MIARVLIAMLALVACAASAAGAAGFLVSSSAFADNSTLPLSGSAPNCGGGSSISPPLAWTDTPPLPANYGAGNAGHVAGANGAGGLVFAGYCPPAGNQPHHYTFTVYATDLAPDALAPGLTRDALLTALHGHVKAAMSLVGRYGR